jgi:hypothetical protein
MKYNPSDTEETLVVNHFTAFSSGSSFLTIIAPLKIKSEIWNKTFELCPYISYPLPLSQ